MERTLDIGDVKKGRMSESFRIKRPKIAKLVERCVSVKPYARPSVKELQNEIEQIVEDIDKFKNTKNCRWGLLGGVKRFLRSLKKCTGCNQNG